MYRIVFSYCTLLLLLLGTFVYSKPYELTELNDEHNAILANTQIKNGNQMIVSVEESELQPKVEHEIIEEEPVIFDISTQVAKFILYFIKKYCKNSDKIGYLQNLLTTKGIGSLFETTAGGNIQTKLGFFENNSPQQSIESTKPKPNVIEQGHAINDIFATAPNYELKSPTIKTETNKKELIHSLELTTQNIHISNQYQTPKIQTEIQGHIENVQPYKPLQENTFTNYKLNLKPTYQLNIPEHLETPKIDDEHAKAEIIEPMYEYASNGDEYGITEYEYALPDYDYSIYPADNTKGETQSTLDVIEHQVPTQNKNIDIFPINIDPVLSKQEVSIIPKFDDTTHQTPFIPTTRKTVHLKPAVSTVQQSGIRQPHFLDKEKPLLEEKTNEPNIINDWYKYIMTEGPKIEIKIQQHKNEQQPKIHKNTYGFTMPKLQLKIENQPETKPNFAHFNQPIIIKNAYEHSTPKLEIIEPGLLDGLYKYIMPENQPEVESHVPQVNVIDHEQTTIKENIIPKYKSQLVNKEPDILDDFYKYIMPEEQPERVEKKEETYELPDLKIPKTKFIMPNFKLKHSIPKYQHEITPIANLEQPQIKEHIFEYPKPDEKHKDTWFNYQPELEHKIEEKVEPSQIYIMNQEQPDFKEPLVEQHVFEYPMPDTKQPDIWFNHQPEVEPKIEGKVEPSQIYIMNQEQPDFKEPLVGQHVFEYPMPDTKQPGIWYNYQPEVEPKIEGKVEPPQVYFMNQEQYDFKEPLVEQHAFEYPVPDTKQPDIWFNHQPEVQHKIEINQEPQVFFIDHKQPDLKEPLITEHTFDYAMPDEKQPDTWLNYHQDFVPKTGVNQEPQVHFIDYQPDIKEPLINQHTFDYSMPHYELNADVKRPGLVENVYEYAIPEFKEETVPHIEDHTESQVHFKNQEQEPHVFDFSMPKFEFKPSDTKQPEADKWFKDPMPEYQQEITPKIEETTQVLFDLKQPQTQKHTFEYSIPIPEYQQEMVPQIGMHHIQQPDTNVIPHLNHQYNFNPYIKIDHQHSNIENPWTGNKKYWLQNIPNKKLSLKMQNENNIPDISLKKYADDLFKNYSVELQKLEDMKPYYKETITEPTYIQFINNMDKMKDVLNVWKYGGHFYEIPSIEYVKKTMTDLSDVTLELMSPSSMIEIEHTTPEIIIKPQTYEITTTKQQPNEDESGSRRTFDGPEELSKYLEDPEKKQEFGTLDLILQNVILAYIEFGKLEKTADNKQRLLMLLHKIKFMMTKYKNLFNQLEWVDEEIENLTKDKDTKITPELIEINNNILFKGSWDLLKRIDLNNKMNFDEGSKIFLTLLNIPVTAQSKSALKMIIHKLLKDIVDISEIHPEFKDVKFYLGEQKSLEETPLYNRLMELVAEPKDFIEHGKLLSITENKVPSENRRASAKEIETETKTEMATTEIVETTMQPTTPKRKIGTHHNIFREFLMNTDA